jgi:hypothetical protein
MVSILEVENMNKKKEESKFKDIYDGENMNVWEDEDLVFMNIYANGVTICFDKADWESFKDDFDALINGEPNRHPAG